jgi:putative addiction module component (TIGR02574 family)
MTTTADELLSALMRLSPNDRGEVAVQLLDSLDLTADPDAEAAWVEEIRIRVEDVRAGRVKGVAWTEARAQIQADGDGGR